MLTVVRIPPDFERLPAAEMLSAGPGAHALDATSDKQPAPEDLRGSHAWEVDVEQRPMRAGCLSCFSFLGRRKLLAPEHAERGAHAEASLGFSPLPLPLETKHEVAIKPPVFAAPPSYPPPIAKDLGSKAMSSPEKAKIAIPGLQMSDEEPGDSEGTEHGAPRAVLTGPRDSPAESDEENFEIPEITYHVVPPRATQPQPQPRSAGIPSWA